MLDFFKTFFKYDKDGNMVNVSRDVYTFYRMGM